MVAGVVKAPELFKYNDFDTYPENPLNVVNDPVVDAPATVAATADPDAQLVKSPFNGK